MGWYIYTSMTKNWITNNISICSQNVDDSLLASTRVSDCILQHNKERDVPLLNLIFDNQIIGYITNTPLFSSLTEDHIISKKESNGEYSVQSTYGLCMQKLLDTFHFKV
jgi:hypothetical protein